MSQTTNTCSEHSLECRLVFIVSYQLNADGRFSLTLVENSDT